MPQQSIKVLNVNLFFAGVLDHTFIMKTRTRADPDQMDFREGKTPFKELRHSAS